MMIPPQREVPLLPCTVTPDEFQTVINVLSRLPLGQVIDAYLAMSNAQQRAHAQATLQAQPKDDPPAA